MGDMMTFPATVEEFMEQYKTTDTEKVYSNGTEFVPIYRMRQWFDHVNQNSGSAVRHGRWKPFGIDNRGRVGRWQCTACHMTSLDGGTYCPKCGAKMDGDG